MESPHATGAAITTQIAASLNQGAFRSTYYCNVATRRSTESSTQPKASRARGCRATSPPLPLAFTRSESEPKQNGQRQLTGKIIFVAIGAGTAAVMTALNEELEARGSSFASANLVWDGDEMDDTTASCRVRW